MVALEADDRKIVRAAGLFSGLPDDAVDIVLKNAHVLECRRGKMLFLRGAPAERFFLVLDGWVKVFRDTPDGEQTVIAIMKSGDTVAEAAVFLERDFPASAEVVDTSRILEIPAKPFLELLRGDRDLALKMIGALSMRLRHMVLHIEQLQARSTSQRLGEFLLGQCAADKGSIVVRLPYDKTLVAARLGMKPESLSRALAKLRDCGVITRGHDVELTDIGKLRGYCQVEDAG